MTTTWVSGGEEWSVTTNCALYDTQAACEDAHEAAVAYWKEIAPEDPS